MPAQRPSLAYNAEELTGATTPASAVGQAPTPTTPPGGIILHDPNVAWLDPGLLLEPGTGFGSAQKMDLLGQSMQEAEKFLEPGGGGGPRPDGAGGAGGGDQTLGLIQQIQDLAKDQFRGAPTFSRNPASEQAYQTARMGERLPGGGSALGGAFNELPVEEAVAGTGAYGLPTEWEQANMSWGEIQQAMDMLRSVGGAPPANLSTAFASGGTPADAAAMGATGTEIAQATPGAGELATTGATGGSWASLIPAVLAALQYSGVLGDSGQAINVLMQGASPALAGLISGAGAATSSAGTGGLLTLLGPMLDNIIQGTSGDYGYHREGANYQLEQATKLLPLMIAQSRTPEALQQNLDEFGFTWGGGLPPRLTDPYTYGYYPGWQSPEAALVGKPTEIAGVTWDPRTATLGGGYESGAQLLPGYNQSIQEMLGGQRALISAAQAGDPAAIEMLDRIANQAYGGFRDYRWGAMPYHYAPTGNEEPVGVPDWYDPWSVQQQGDLTLMAALLSGVGGA